VKELRVALLGRLEARYGGEIVSRWGSSKAQELFCFLVLFRGQAHPREALAGRLWPSRPAAEARPYLRRALWQVQTALNRAGDGPAVPVLLADPETLQLNPAIPLWLDVAVLEEARRAAAGIPGRRFEPALARQVREAVDAARGSLLEGWYQEWCLAERERLQGTAVGLLGKLMGYCEARGEYEAGLTYGSRILHMDRAHEPTHRRLMRLHGLAGDRTAALRQYQRCVDALAEELGTVPARNTVVLARRLRADRFGPQEAAPPGSADRDPQSPAALGRLQNLQAALIEAERKVEQEIEALESGLERPGHALGTLRDTPV
jgi:DNA-binding SARP family transcriptional activator